MRAAVVSFELLTETYSPSAIEMAPPMRAAAPAATIAGVDGVALATPTTTAATDTIPSFAPSTPARNQFSRAATPATWGSSGCPDVLTASANHADRRTARVERRAVPDRRLLATSLLPGGSAPPAGAQVDFAHPR